MVELFTNLGSATQPLFNAGVFLQYGPPGSKTDIDVGSRATPQPVDWNSDGRKDLLVGGLDGLVRLYLNGGTDTAPDFPSQAFVQQGAGNLSVPSGRASPWLAQVGSNVLRDLTCGNTSGQIIWYENTGSATAPVLATGVALHAGGAEIAAGSRSRHVVCDWNDDPFPDLLVGSYGGKVHLYVGIPEPGALVLLLIVLGIGRRSAHKCVAAAKT